jgi:hypothetical protein
MSKEINNSKPVHLPQKFNNSSLSENISDHSNLDVEDPMEVVLRETDPTNIGYRTGVILKKLFDYASSKLSFTLPTVGAAPISNKQTLSADEEFLDLLDKAEFNYHSDTTKKDMPPKRRELVIKNIKESFKSLANEGEWTSALLKEALKADIQFTIIDSRYSPKEVAKWQKIMGGTIGGMYKSQTNELVIIATHDGTNSETTIKHEAIHYLETIFGKNYDAASIEKCKKDLDKNLGVGAVLCLNNPTRKECKEINEYAALYKNRPLKKLSSKVDFTPDKNNPNSGVTGIVTIGTDWPKLNVDGAVVRVEKDGDFSILKLEAMQNLKTGIKRKSTKKEENLFNMAFNIENIPNRKVIEQSYLRASTQIKDSEHYAELSAQPEKILDSQCKKIMPLSYKKLNSKADRDKDKQEL